MCTADPDSLCAERVQRAPQEPHAALATWLQAGFLPPSCKGASWEQQVFASWVKEKLQATGWAVVSLSPGACWELASSTSPAQHSGHTAIAPTARPPARSPGCADSRGAVFDRKGPGFLGQPGVGLRAAGAFPQAAVPAVRFGRSAPLVCGCSGVATHPRSPAEKAGGLSQSSPCSPRSLCLSLSRKLSGSLSRVSPPWAPTPAAFPCWCLGSSPRPWMTVLPSPRPEQGPLGAGGP